MDRNTLKSYLEKLLNKPMKDKIVKSILVNPKFHNQPKRLIETGRTYSELEPGAPEEEVLAIFESMFFCVCTASRGAGQGMPYLFTRDDVLEVKYEE